MKGNVALKERQTDWSMNRLLLGRWICFYGYSVDAISEIIYHVDGEKLKNEIRVGKKINMGT